MRPKGKPESKIPTTKTNTNKRKAAENPGGKVFDTSIIKKNEFALILGGALLLTIIIFFVFFRSSDPKTESVKKSNPAVSLNELEKRIGKIEQLLKVDPSASSSGEETIILEKSGIEPVKERVTRLETAFSVKFDSLIERMTKLEKSIQKLQSKPVASVSKPAVKKSAPPVKKAVKKEKKASMFHTVQKGETLYSISKKYNTSVNALRKLNNLSTNAKIYPGNNILVR